MHIQARRGEQGEIKSISAATRALLDLAGVGWGGVRIVGV